MEKRPFDDDISDAEILRPRPEWMKFYYQRWNDSVKLLDAEQRGWYHNLLMYAASQGEPPGYLNNDLEELRQIAEVKDLGADAIAIFIKTDEGRQYISHWKERQDKRWKKVLSKFSISTRDSKLLYNKMLVSTLQDAYRKQQQTIRAGRLSWSAREGGRQQSDTKQPPLDESKQLETKPLRANVQKTLDNQEDILPLTPLEHKQPETNGLGANAVTSVRTDAGTKPEQASTYISFPIVNNTVLGINPIERKDKKDDISFEELRNSVVKERPSLLKKKSETVFEEDKFVITEEMSFHLSQKHSDFISGDWDYMVEEFKNVFYGKKKASWKRTFYTFVNNQRMRYGYESGDYLKRQTQPNAQRQSTQQPTRHQLAERGLNELSTRYLQESGLGNTENTEEALPLTSNDIRNSS